MSGDTAVKTFSLNFSEGLKEDVLTPNKAFKHQLLASDGEIRDFLSAIVVERNEGSDIKLHLTVPLIIKPTTDDASTQSYSPEFRDEGIQSVPEYVSAGIQHSHECNEIGIQAEASVTSVCVQFSPSLSDNSTSFDPYFGTTTVEIEAKPEIDTKSIQHQPETVSVRIQNCPITQAKAAQISPNITSAEVQCVADITEDGCQCVADMIDNETQHHVETQDAETEVPLEFEDKFTQASVDLVDAELQCDPPAEETLEAPTIDIEHEQIDPNEDKNDKVEDEVLDEYGMKTRHTQTDPVTFIGGNIAIRGKLNIKQVIVEKSPNKNDKESSPAPSSSRGRGRSRSSGTERRTYARKSQANQIPQQFDEDDDYVPPHRIKQENVYGKRQRAKNTIYAEFERDEKDMPHLEKERSPEGNDEIERPPLLEPEDGKNSNSRRGRVLTRGAGVRTRGGVKRYTLSSPPEKVSLVGRRVNPRPDTSRPVPVPTLSEPSENGFSCPFCTFRYQNSSELYGHLQIEHAKDRRYVGLNKKRPNCNWEEHQLELDAAGEERTEVSEEDLYDNDEPPVKKFRTTDDIPVDTIDDDDIEEYRPSQPPNTNRRYVRNDKPVAAGFTPYHCPLCHLKLSNWNYVYGHLNRIHTDHEEYEETKTKLEEMCPELIEKDEDDEKSDEKDDIEGDDSKDDGCRQSSTGDFNCEICDKVFWSETRFLQHQKTHVVSKSHKCQYCERSFQHSENLKRHVSTVHERSKVKRCVCEHCGKTFNYQMNLQEHIMSAHRQKQPYICDRCNAGFVRRKDLLAHSCHSPDAERIVDSNTA